MNRLAMAAAAVLMVAPLTLAQQWIVGGGVSTSRGIWDYTQGSAQLTNFRSQTAPTFSISGVEHVAGVTYVLTTLQDNKLNIASFSGSSMSLNAVTGALGNSVEGDLGFNPADGFFYSVENTPGTTTKKIWRINPSGWTAALAGSFTADDPSGIAFDNAGNGLVMDSRFNTGGLADLIQIDVMTTPGSVAFKSPISLGLSTGATLGMDFDPLTNDPYFMTASGKFFKIGSYLSAAPTTQLVEQTSGGGIITGLAYIPVPSPASAALLAAAGVVGAPHRRRSNIKHK